MPKADFSHSDDLNRRILVIIGIILILSSLTVLVGWRYDIDVLKKVLSMWPTMKINTALCFLMSGFLILHLSGKTPGISAEIPARVLSVIIMLTGFMTVLEFLSGSDFGIDQVFINEILRDPAELYPGRMTFLAAVNFIFASFAFLFHCRRSPDWKVHACAELILVNSLFSICNHIFQNDLNFTEIAYTIMAFHSIILFILLACGILLLRPDTGIIGYLTVNSTSGYYMRRLLPVVLTTPIFLAITNITLKNMGLIKEHIGDSFVTTGASVLISVAIYFAVRKIDRDEKVLISAESKIHENEIIFREFTDHIDIVFYRTTPDFERFIYISPAYEKIWGKSSESLYKNPKDWFESIYPEDQEKVYRTFFTKLQGNSQASTEYRIKRPDGATRYILSRAFIVQDMKKNIFALMGIAVDITEEKLDEQYHEVQVDILKRLENAATISDVAPKILRTICQAFSWDLGEIWLVDKSGDILRCVDVWHTGDKKMVRFNSQSRRFTFKFGEDLPGRIWKEKKTVWIPNFSQNEKFMLSMYAQNAGLKCTLAFPIIFKNNVFGILEFYSEKIQNPDDKLLSLIDTIGKSLGEFIHRMNASEEIQTLSRHDILTGLLNRSALVENLDSLISRRGSEIIAIIVIDIDQFKTINIAMGYNVGDEVLKLISRRLEKLSPQEKIILARIGSNKFILCLHHITHKNDVVNFVRKIEQSMMQPFRPESEDIFLTMSAGITLYPQDGSDSQVLMANAELSLAEAKKRHGMKTVFYTPEISVAEVEKLRMNADLRQAMATHQFFLNFQPQVNLKTGAICGAEALVRWQHPVKGLISPADFITFAEQADLIIPFNEHVMRLVFQLIGMDWKGPPVSINISAQQLSDKYHFSEYLESLIVEYCVDPKNIHLEITESMLVDDSQHTIAIVSAINQLGIRLAIDDFGTGFSSFSYLYRISADTVKIDRSFIAGLPDNMANAIIVKAMISMVHALGKEVVAEGAETEREVEFLKKADCDVVQGYYYYKPMSAQDYIALTSHGQEVT